MNKIKNFLKNTEGVAAIEFALTLPLLMILLYGSIETARFALAKAKVNKTAYAISNYVSQLADPGSQNSANINISFNSMMQPFQSGESSGWCVGGVRKFEGKIQSIFNYGGGFSPVCDTNTKNIVISAGEVIIKVGARYKYSSLLGLPSFLPTSMQLDGRKMETYILTRHRSLITPKSNTPISQPEPFFN